MGVTETVGKAVSVLDTVLLVIELMKVDVGTREVLLVVGAAVAKVVE